MALDSYGLTYLIYPNDEVLLYHCKFAPNILIRCLITQHFIEQN